MEQMLNHPDEAADMALISEKIVPIILSQAERIDALESRLSSAEEIITKMITGFKGAAENQRRHVLGQNIRSQYGTELDGVMPIYKKLVGEDRDPVDDIVEAVMKLRDQAGYSPDMDGEYIKDMMNQILGRFGLDSLKQLINPAVEAVSEAPEGSIEVEVSGPAEELVETDPLEELRAAKKRGPKIKL